MPMNVRNSRSIRSPAANPLRFRSTGTAIIMLLGLGLSALQPAQAQPPNPTDNQPAAPEQSNSSPPGPSNQDGTAPESTGLWERSHLLGTIGGVRDVLGEYGISLGLTETSEILGNPTGGRA